MMPIDRPRMHARMYVHTRMVCTNKHAHVVAPGLPRELRTGRGGGGNLALEAVGRAHVAPVLALRRELGHERLFMCVCLWVGIVVGVFTRLTGQIALNAPYIYASLRTFQRRFHE